MGIEKIKNFFAKRGELNFQFVRPFQLFLKKEASSSLLLALATLIALIWANSPYSSTYHHFWETDLTIALGDIMISKSLRHWIDEGLMAVFFFIVGLEIKREILVGELASFRKALLPVAAAIGGMLVPALIYFSLNYGQPSAHGWGIPMATDIAFALGAIYVLGNRVPLGLRIFLSAFAIADDLGAVFVIALFYTKEIVVKYFLVSLLIVSCIAVLSFFQVRKTLFYAVLGIGLWLALLGTGLHATVAGIVIAMFIPARGRYDTDRFIQEVGYFLSEFQCPPEGCGHSILLNQRHLSVVQSIEMACHHVETPLQRLEHSLHPWVAFVVVPLFALANAGIVLEGMDVMHAVTSPLTLGIILGLLLGKPLGITFMSWLAVKSGLASLPKGVTWPHIIGASILGGIGFTMSMFIAGLSFERPEMLDYAKLGILIASFVAGVAGLITLYLFCNRFSKSRSTVH